MLYTLNQSKACKPPWTKLGKKLESSVRKALFDFNLAEDPKIAIAMSGGKDSLSMLHLLKAISARGFAKFDLCMIHVSGTFSCGPSIQKNFLEKISQDLQVPLHIVHAEQDRSKLECYSCSRQRRKLLFKKAHELGYKTIAFGHHADDNSQTLFLNLFHKGEFAGMLPKLSLEDFGITIIRPLIYIFEKDIINFAKHYGFSRIMCQCPIGQNSMRKQVDTIITSLEKKFPNVRTNLSQASLKYGSNKASKK